MNAVLACSSNNTCGLSDSEDEEQTVEPQVSGLPLRSELASAPSSSVSQAQSSASSSASTNTGSGAGCITHRAAQTPPSTRPCPSVSEGQM